MFKGKNFIITGASSGIGETAAVLLASAGANIIALARDKNRLTAVTEALPGHGHQAIASDAADEETVGELVKAGRSVGGIDGALLAAGAHTMMPLSLSGNNAFEEMHRLNVLTAINGIKAVTKTARKEGAAIVMISSISAIRGSPGFVAYAAAKAALLGLARSAAVELAPKKIRVNTVLAGVVNTPLSETWLGRVSGTQRQQIMDKHLLGEGRPQFVAEAALFLMSDKAYWITGTELAVDGGLSIG